MLATEIRALGGADVCETRSAVTFGGPLPVGYRVCLWSRLASRVLLALADFPAATAEDLYAGVSEVPWEEYVSPEGTLAIDATGTTSGLSNSRFSAQKAKDAIVDRIRDRTGVRPSVDLDRPDVRVNLRLARDRATLSLDLSGAPLHERGYRTPGEQAEAPLKENLAAAVLVSAGWPEVAAAGGALVDPMCGSGTLLVEGALIAADQAPGLLREYWGFTGWLGHDPNAWHELLDEADGRAEAGRANMPPIMGFDADASAIELTRACAKRAGFGGVISAEQRELSRLAAPGGASTGLVVTNPPYGVRLGEAAALQPLYETLGQKLLAGFTGWRAAVFTSDESLARAIGLRSTSARTLYNGAIEAKVYRFEVSQERVRAQVRRAPAARSAGAEMLANRIGKNLRHLGKWARREGVTCLRVYDADLPEYAVAVDLYEGSGRDAGRRFAHVAEYAPPPEIPPAVAEARLADATQVVADVLEVAPDDVVVKVRMRQRGTSQYERVQNRGEFVEVSEGGLRFEVNLYDYLDTGLFLDHRPVRAMVRELAAGTRFCNLFAYTGTASVYAAAGGARAISTADLSEKYLAWARRNMELNGFGEMKGARYFATDALRWLAEERRRIVEGLADPYGLVFCDPPTYSSSQKMTARTFDVQRDHVRLISDAAALLEPGGVLVFSTNLRTFRLDAEALPHLSIEDITPATVPPDFARTPRIHQCFLVRGA